MLQSVTYLVQGETFLQFTSLNNKQASESLLFDNRIHVILCKLYYGITEMKILTITLLFNSTKKY
jgi:hypothetical protein